MGKGACRCHLMAGFLNRLLTFFIVYYSSQLGRKVKPVPVSQRASQAYLCTDEEVFIT